MFARNSFLKILSAAFSLVGLIGCGSSSESPKNSPAPIHSPDIGLNEIKIANCLNLEKYLNLLNSGIGNPTARRVSTNFEIIPFKENHISQNFQLRLGLGNFLFDEAPISEFKELNSVSQVDCEKVIQTNESGPQEFKIIKSENDSITISNVWNEELTYQWASPNHLIVTSKFVNGDYLCDENSKGRVTVTKEFFWATELEKTDSISQGLIKDTYLDLLSNATGYSKSNLFIDPNTQPELPESTPSNRIYTSRLKEMLAQPIKPEAMLCN